MRYLYIVLLLTAGCATAPPLSLTGYHTCIEEAKDARGVRLCTEEHREAIHQDASYQADRHGIPLMFVMP